MISFRTFGALFVIAALAGCSRGVPPSEQLEKVAEEVVEATVEGAGGAQTAIPAGPFAPRDECSDVKGASAFLTSLRGAVEGRDTDVLVALSAQDIKLDFGGGTGAAELRRRLDSDDGILWSALEELLTLGCASDGEAGLTLPYYFAQDFKGDPYSAFIVTGTDVPLLSAPGDGASELAKVSWDVVELLPGERDLPNSHHVRWDGSSDDQAEPVEGYIAKEHLRSMIDIRLIAASRNGRWRIVSLVAGD